MEAGGLRKQMLNGTADRFDIPTIPYPSAHTFIISSSVENAFSKFHAPKEG